MHTSRDRYMCILCIHLETYWYMCILCIRVHRHIIITCIYIQAEKRKLKAQNDLLQQQIEVNMQLLCMHGAGRVGCQSVYTCNTFHNQLFRESYALFIYTVMHSTAPYKLNQINCDMVCKELCHYCGHVLTECQVRVGSLTHRGQHQS